LSLIGKICESNVLIGILQSLTAVCYLMSCTYQCTNTNMDDLDRRKHRIITLSARRKVLYPAESWDI
jgi:hypothetical protein